MSLRSRLFLAFGGLIALLAGAEWALVSALTRELEREVGEVAFEVGSDVLGTIFEEVEENEPPAGLVVAGRRGPGPGLLRCFSLPSDARIGEVHRALGALALGRLRPRSEPGLLLELSEVGLCEKRREGACVECIEFEIFEDLEEVAGHVHTNVQFQLRLSQAGYASASDELPIHLASGAEVAWMPVGSDDPPVVEDEGDILFGGQTGVLPTSSGPLAVQIPIPRSGIEEARSRFLRRLLLGSGGIFALGLLLAGWLSHRVTRPLRDLASAARAVGDGALGTHAEAAADREVAETLTAFNQMSDRLAELDAEARSLREREHLSEIGEMARGLAHAMRNPLHMLGLAVGGLAERVGEQGNGLAESARGQIQRIDQSLRSLLALASGSTGAIETVAVDDLARDVALELLQEKARGVRVEVLAPEPCTLRGVAAELRAVLHVLVVNAVEASPDGERVEVRVACDAAGVTMEVLDRGDGLAQEVRGMLFTPHLTTKVQGAGMGLFLAQRIAASRYGGSLALEDRARGGTRAVLALTDRRDGGG